VNKFIFDVDGTLTPSRQTMNEEFRKWFIDFCDSNDVYLVTGSDYAKTLEQVGVEVCMSVKRIYNCSGADVYEQGVNVRTSDWTAPKELYDLMYGWLQASKFPARMGNHIEERPGMVNFSIVGRGATLAERKMYVDYDTASRERESIAHQINTEFEDITATVGGETGLDIAPTGSDKSQILKDFSKEDKIYFFGDRTEPGGNDYPIAKLLGKSAFQVKGWRDTWERLQYFQEAKVAA
jgi:phosphomannomutase